MKNNDDEKRFEMSLSTLINIMVDEIEDHDRRINVLGKHAIEHKHEYDAGVLSGWKYTKESDCGFIDF